MKQDFINFYIYNFKGKDEYSGEKVSLKYLVLIIFCANFCSGKFSLLTMCKKWCKYFTQFCTKNTELKIV